MAPPAAPSAAAPEPHQRDASASAKRSRPGGCAAGAGARIVSLGVRGAVMVAALVLFLLFAAAAVVLMLALLVAARAFRQQGRRRRRFRAEPEYPPLPPPAPGLPSAKIRLLPCFLPSSTCLGDGDGVSSSSPGTCAVCLDAARAGERWRALPACGHVFHAACVDRWLLLSPGCPVCRATVSVPFS